MLSRFALGAALISAAFVPLVSARSVPATLSVEDVKLPELLVGSDAPALAVEKWVKGTPVANLEKGKVYMVEFWATWCGPCIRGMPHLSELQKKYGPQGLTIIGVTSQDKRNTLEAVEKMVTDKGETMAYTVAWDNGQKTKEAYFAAAGQNGIPCAFLVDRDGKIAYIGHPMSIDKTLDDVINKKHDIKALAATYKKQIEVQAKSEALQEEFGQAFQGEDWPKALEAADKLIALDAEENAQFVHAKFMILGVKMKEEDKAYAFAKEMLKGPTKDNANLLNAFAWTVISEEDGFTKKDLDFALSCATDADKLTKGENPMILDTLARTHFLKGDAKKAVEVQTKAVGLVKDKKQKAAFEKTLDEYKAAAEKKTGG
jgi:thiol-disulfide isomerase/thioredoxin